MIDQFSHRKAHSSAKAMAQVITCRGSTWHLRWKRLCHARLLLHILKSHTLRLPEVKTGIPNSHPGRADNICLTFTDSWCRLMWAGGLGQLMMAFQQVALLGAGDFADALTQQVSDLSPLAHPKSQRQLQQALDAALQA